MPEPKRPGARPRAQSTDDVGGSTEVGAASPQSVDVLPLRGDDYSQAMDSSPRLKEKDLFAGVVDLSDTVDPSAGVLDLSAGIVDLSSDAVASADTAPAVTPPLQAPAPDAGFENVHLTPVDENSPPFESPVPRKRSRAPAAAPARALDAGADPAVEVTPAPAAVAEEDPSRLGDALRALRERVRALPARAADFALRLRERVRRLRPPWKARPQAEGEAAPAPAQEGAVAKLARRLVPRFQLTPTFLVVNTVLLAAMLGLEARAAATAWRADAREDERGSPQKTDPQPGPTLPLSKFVVRLRGSPPPPDAGIEGEPPAPSEERYARMSFELELPDEAKKLAATLRVPRIREAFLAYLSDRSVEDFRGVEAIARVKAGLAERLAQVVPDAEVRRVYLTELIVQ